MDEKKESNLGADTTVDNFFADDLGGLDVDIFDDDADLGNVFDDDNDAEDQKKKAASSSDVGSAVDAMMNKRNSTTSASIEGLPLPHWHSGAADRPHRESMTREM